MNVTGLAKLTLIAGFSVSLFAAHMVSANASDERRDFVEANILSIFYHELGHAIVDIEGVAIFGQEEDAADNFAIFVIDAFFDERAASSLAADAALGFEAEARARADGGDDVVWWDIHGPDEQRFFNAVCIFYGADPDSRTSFAADLGLPSERAESCAEEFEQVHQSWGSILDRIAERGAGQSISFSGETGSIAERVISLEIDELNRRMVLSRQLKVAIEPCGEANAYYDPEASKITFCSEFEPHLFKLQKLL